MEKALQGLLECEKRKESDPAKVSRWFGELMAELMIFREDAFSPILRELGDSLGRFIYLMDACMDLEEDKKKGCYNPLFVLSESEAYDDVIKEMMTKQITKTTIALEKLPLEQDVCILRNILYEGVWMKYERKQNHDK